MKSKTATKYQLDGLFYSFLKKHKCPKCGTTLTRGFRSTMVQSNSAEAKDKDISLGDTYLLGTVELKEIVFHCSKCGWEATVKEMKNTERKP